MYVFGGYAVVQPHRKTITVIGRYTAVRHVTIAALNSDINAVPLVERDTTIGDIDVHGATQHVHARHVIVIRHRGLVNVQGRS